MPALHWWMIGLTVALGALLLVSGRLRGRGAELTGVRRGLPALLIATALLLILLLAARRYEEVRSYALLTAVGSALFGILFGWFFSWSHWSERTVRGLVGISPLWLGVIVAVLAAGAGRFVLGGIPHVSDEVAYQFQARALALGQLALPEPAVPEAFTFLHLMVHDGRWYGIMNPGWPAFLAVGELIRLPWIINPVLGGLALLVFAAFFREAGLNRLEGRLAVLLMAASPLLLFMSGTYMAHPVNLLLFGVFCWAWARMLNRGDVGAAAIAGLALALNLLVRPVDTVAATLPFGLQLLWHLRKRPRLLLHAVIVTVIGGGGIGATLAYNRALTGHALEMPMTQYFMERNPQERFGIGFGSDMGTKLHGDEWPGFTPVDAVRVTAYRLVEFLKDLYGLPLIVLAGLIAATRASWREWGEWRLMLVASAGTLAAVYFMHFYHGIAYGSRHYYLAIPAMAVVLAAPLARRLESADPGSRPLAAAAVLAGLVTLVTFTFPLLVREYGSSYRGVSPAVATAVRREGIHRAVIFVEPGSWSWKSAFPLNRYPLGESDLIFARDRGNRNTEVLAEFPSRPVYYLAVGPADRVTIRAAPTSAKP